MRDSAYGMVHPFIPPLWVKFVSAGMAGCVGDIMTFPLDVAKVRLQVQVIAPGETPKYKGIFGTMRTLVKEEGASALYRGIAPGLQRQLAFCSIRVGLYDQVKAFYSTLITGNDRMEKHQILIRIMSGISTGALAVSCAQPTDVVKVRMQADTGGRYNGCIDAYKKIAKFEGVPGLYKGLLPNIARNAIVNCGELVTYDIIKTWILSKNILSDSMPCHFVSAFGAGFCATLVASPVDVVKTRFMNSEPGKYRGALHCGMLMFQESGPKAFYKGFFPSFMRLATWNIVMFVCFEQLKKSIMDLKHLRDNQYEPVNPDSQV